MSDCIFCRIVKGEIPSYKVDESDDFYAFLSISPHTKGHTLVIPKEHTDYFFDLSDEMLSKLMLFTKPLAERLKVAIEPKTGKIGVLVAGLEVLHAHLHLIPMDGTSDLDFSRAKKASTEELEATLKKLLGG
jgi:histidine triad (HIT) family protein